MICGPVVGVRWLQIAIGQLVSLMDGSTNVREAAVDLIGRFIISKPELFNQYYEMLTARILVSDRASCDVISNT